MFWDFIQWMFINLMVALGLASLAYNLGGRSRVRSFWTHVTAASVMAVFCLVFPWRVGPGQQMDLRLIPLMLAGWDGGWLAAGVVGVVIIAARFYIGGPGALTTLVYTILAVAVVPFFTGRKRRGWSLLTMALVVAALGYVVGQTMVQPSPPGLEPTSPYWLMLAGVQVLSVWLIDTVIQQTLDRRRLKESLAEELRTKEAVLELIPYGILFLDGTGAVTGCNEAARLLMDGCSQLPQLLAHPDIQRSLREHKRVSDCRVVLRGGRSAERIMLVSSVPLDRGGVVLGFENVTGVIHQVRAEANRDRLELLGRLAAMAAHEVKNPLTTIKGFLQLLAGKPEFEPHRATFNLVQGEVEHINRVVSDFLELSGNGGHRPDVVDLDEQLREVIAVAELQFAGQQVSVRFTGADDLLVMADPRSLKQILKNLVGNAFEAMPEGGTLELRRERCAEGVRVTVTDTGPGIAADMLPLIFTPYVTTKATGTGLGLVISHKLASEMGGQLAVQSVPGQGCSFALTLQTAPPGFAEAAAAHMPG